MFRPLSLVPLTLVMLGLVGSACRHRSDGEARGPDRESGEEPKPRVEEPTRNVEEPKPKAEEPKPASTTCGTKDDVERAGRTGIEGAKTGVTTGVEGVKTFGKATAGLFQGGTDEATRRWNEGKEQTKATAREGAAKTHDEANTDPCK